MKKGSQFILMITLMLVINACLNRKSINKTDVTFFVAADLHFDPPPESDQYYHVVAMNSVCGSIKDEQALKWPVKINEIETLFGSAGQTINPPDGVVIVGDITDRADPGALKLFKERYEVGQRNNEIHFNVYLGLGNHDLDPQHVEGHEIEYSNQMLQYVRHRHIGNAAPVRIINFDSSSCNYSWNWGKIHLIQTHRFAGNVENGCYNSLKWMLDDLETFAAMGEPVIIFQHYGFDKFSLEWWTEKERNALYDVISSYNIVAIFVGHNHYAENMIWKGIPVFQVNNAWSDSDGNGSFAVCHITEKCIDVITCRWKDGEGNVELVNPFYTKTLSEK